MYVSEVKINNIKGFDGEHNLALSPSVNVLVGHNNAGKSVLINSILISQIMDANKIPIRIGKSFGKVIINFNNLDAPYVNRVHSGVRSSSGFKIYVSLKNGNCEYKVMGGESSEASHKFGGFSATEPDNFIYPHLANRKAVVFDENVSIRHVNSVTGSYTNLYAKIDRISDAQSPSYEKYKEICKQVFGFVISTSGSPNGKKAVLKVDDFNNIPLDAMGAGTASLLGLIVDLCVAKNKLFLIEELENDLHPRALKHLLNLIIEKSSDNQFVVSTHSNIVLKYLGAVNNAKIFRFDSEVVDRVPKCQVRELGEDVDERRSILEYMGYEFSDIDLWDSWLFLEESSAERMIRQYLIPWFVPELTGKLRTFSARTADEVEVKFADFDRLFVYVHLVPIYKSRAWVVLDGDVKGKEVIVNLKSKYVSSGWSESHFLNFKEENFEKYYPEIFSNRVTEALSAHKNDKRHLKKQLLDDVLGWLDADEEEGRKALEKSASEVIDVLRAIKDSLTR